MTTPNLDETLPTRVPSQAEEASGTSPLAETTPTSVAQPLAQPPSEPPAAPPPPVSVYKAPRRGLPTWLTLSIVSIITLLIIAGMSAYGGYRSGLFDRNSLASTQSAEQLKVQYDLALQDMDAQRYELALQRFEWLVRQDPNYPGVQEKLVEVYLILHTTATPTVVPTPTLTPTPDLRSIEDLYTQGQMAMAAGDWDAAIETMLKLRKKAPEFHAIDIDGMLYVALRNRGVEKIKNADLESGTYDLTLAERFGPLDVEAKNYREWSELYITGASFWELDWKQALSYFSQLAVTAPYLTDASGWTSIERYRRALLGYGDQLASQGDWCGAQEQYKLAQESKPNPEVEPTATYAEEQCSGGAGPEDGSNTGEPGTGEQPTPEATPTLGEGVTPEPTLQSTEVSP